MDLKFSWTQEYRRSWEESYSKIKKFVPIQGKEFNPNRKSIIRHLLLCIDTSASIEKQDYVPAVRNVVSNKLPDFVRRFSEENPLSIISFLTCRNTFDKYSRVFEPDTVLNTVGSGHFSFLNCLKSAVEFLAPSSYNREILLITASIGTKDTGSYEEILASIKKYNIKVSIISICGEVSLFKKIATISNGLFCVPHDHNHFEILLNKFTEPLESLEPTSCLVKLGFPRLTSEIALCNCHFKLEKDLYECPVCKAFVCSLPNQCPVCETQLVSPINISKSYYFMYPLKPFDKIEDGSCKKCDSKAEYMCTECKNPFCIDCARFLHEELGFCIYCKK